MRKPGDVEWEYAPLWLAIIGASAWLEWWGLSEMAR
jgi:hypothetical protein